MVCLSGGDQLLLLVCGVVFFVMLAFGSWRHVVEREGLRAEARDLERRLRVQMGDERGEY